MTDEGSARSETMKELRGGDYAKTSSGKKIKRMWGLATFDAPGENALPCLAGSAPRRWAGLTVRAYRSYCATALMQVCAGPRVALFGRFLGQGRKPMTGTPVIHVVDDDASTRKAISR